MSYVQSTLPSNLWLLPTYKIGPIKSNLFGEHRPYVADPSDRLSSREGADDGIGSGSAIGIKSSVLSVRVSGVSKADIRKILAFRRFQDIRPTWRSVTEPYELNAKRLHGSA